MKNFAVSLVLLGAITAAPALRAQGGSTAQAQPPTVASVLNMHYGIVEQEVVSAAEAMARRQVFFRAHQRRIQGCA